MTSGHYDKYKDNMFMLEDKHSDVVEKQDGIDNEAEQHKLRFSFKPMNCPSHCIIFKKMNLSYRELPIRLADFGVLHRNEFHGALTGLSRVRNFCQDDAHIFCRFQQIEKELNDMIDLILYVYEKFGMSCEVELSTRHVSYIGSLDSWNKAESILKKIITTFDNHEINEGDGAFYGPKLDVTVCDAFNRKHQLATVQLDFNLPERFDLKYDSEVGEDRPVMIHRAILGSIERFISIMLEHGQCNIPLFVSPRQVAILTLNNSEDIVNYAKQVKKQMSKNSMLKHIDIIYDNTTLQKKIKNTSIMHYNYIVVVGNKEVTDNIINVRSSSSRLMQLSVDDFMESLQC